MTRIWSHDVVTIDHDPDAIDAGAAQLVAVATAVRDAGTQADTAWAGLAGHYDSPDRDLLFAALAPIRAEAEAFVGSYEATSAALIVFATEIRGLIATRAQLYHDVGDLSDDIRICSMDDANTGSTWADDADLDARNTANARANAQLETALQDAEDALARALGAIVGGTAEALPPAEDAGLGGPTSPSSGGSLLAAIGAATPTRATYLSYFDAALAGTTSERLDRLARMNADELAAWSVANADAIHDLIDDPMSLERTEQWWAGLPAATQAFLLAGAPLLVGNMNGVPWNARSAANRTTMAREIDRLRNVTANALCTPESTEAELAAHRANLDQIVLYERILSDAVPYATPEGPTPTPRTVLVFDPERSAYAEYLGILEADGRIPERTQHIGVYTPGTYTTLNTIGEQQRIGGRQVELDPERTTGMVIWQGGVFPQGAQAANASHSIDLGSRLASFTNAIPEPAGADVTAIGYSYGGAVVGRAELAGMEVDRVVHVSSAGLGHDVRSLDQYPATAHVPHYAMMAPLDIVVGLSQGLQLSGGPNIGHGASPLETDGVTRLDTGYVDDAAGRGSGPVTSHFVWKPGNSVELQVSRVIVGGEVVVAPADAADDLLETDEREYANMHDDYLPTTIDSRWGR